MGYGVFWKGLQQNKKKRISVIDRRDFRTLRCFFKIKEMLARAKSHGTGETLPTHLIGVSKCPKQISPPPDGQWAPDGSQKRTARGGLGMLPLIK